MATIAERILEAIQFGPLDDDVLAERLGVSPRQSINQAARRLEQQGRLRRFTGPDEKIVNALPEHPMPESPRPAEAPVRVQRLVFSEDDVKAAVKAYLEERGFDVAVAWGKERGVDIDARHLDGRRYMIEAKGGLASDQQQGSYFLGAIGELVQRMVEPEVQYGLALPLNRRYRGLVNRLPHLAWERLGVVVFWVLRDLDGVMTVEVQERPQGATETTGLEAKSPVEPDEEIY